MLLYSCVRVAWRSPCFSRCVGLPCTAFLFFARRPGAGAPGAGAVKNTNGGVSNLDAETQRQTPKLRTNLDTNFLKLFAILTMVVDHVGTVFFPQHPEFRWVGRLAFPIFCY